jgi:hypothetical protein
MSTGVEPVAAATAAQPDGELLDSGSCGLIIHRTGQLHYEFGPEALAFSADLQGYLNSTLAGSITTLVFQEVFGAKDRLHWLIHLKQPNAYQQILEMVDHDDELQDISTGDRLAEKGGGNWERMFLQGTLRERIIAPQHGLTDPADYDPAELFVPPARHQTAQPADVQLTSATAGAIVHRTAEVRYDLRKESRAFAFEWQELVNTALPGLVTSFLYEETFGRQDRIHWLIHLRSLADHARLAGLAEEVPAMAELLAGERVPAGKGGGGWDRLFVPASIHDVVLVPRAAGAPALREF